MSPERRHFGNQRSRSRAQQYAVGRGVQHHAQSVRRAHPSQEYARQPRGCGEHIDGSAEGSRPVVVGDTASQASGCARVDGMFAHSTQNWWWTAHPAAH
ncbi:trp operon leader peptide [Streptomyces sp. MMCC 100]